MLLSCQSSIQSCQLLIMVTSLDTDCCKGVLITALWHGFWDYDMVMLWLCTSHEASFLVNWGPKRGQVLVRECHSTLPVGHGHLLHGIKGEHGLPGDWQRLLTAFDSSLAFMALVNMPEHPRLLLSQSSSNVEIMVSCWLFLGGLFYCLRIVYHNDFDNPSRKRWMSL